MNDIPFDGLYWFDHQLLRNGRKPEALHKGFWDHDLTRFVLDKKLLPPEPQPDNFVSFFDDLKHADHPAP